jgi:hypothetical protein
MPNLPYPGTGFNEFSQSLFACSTKHKEQQYDKE